MEQRIYTGSDAMTLKLPVTAYGEQTLRVIVKDAFQEKTVLTDVVKTISGNYNFFVMMPLCRKYVDVIIVNDEDNSDAGFVYNGFKKMALVRRMSDVDFSTFRLKEYIRFIQHFSYNAGVLPVNDKNNPKSFYHSENKNFWIKYLPVITDAGTGQEIETPARIATDGSFIEVSQKYIMDYSVPMRVSILLHEYSHPFVNENPSDEIEADLNGLFIYLALGYPRMEGGQAWCEVADNTPTDENVERVRIVEQFIKDFDKNKMVIYQ